MCTIGAKPQDCLVVVVVVVVVVPISHVLNVLRKQGHSHAYPLLSSKTGGPVIVVVVAVVVEVIKCTTSMAGLSLVAYAMQSQVRAMVDGRSK